MFVELELPDTQGRLRTGGRTPSQVFVGSDGTIWFNEWTGIGYISRTGKIIEVKASRGAADLVATPDGFLWFTESDASANMIARYGDASGLTECQVPTPASQPMGLAFAPDGAIWFTEYAANKIGRITLDGE